MFSYWIYRLKRPYHFVKTGLLKGLPAQVKFHHPEKQIKPIVISGTDGKTTTTSLIYHILTTAGIKSSLLTTVSAKIGSSEIDTGFHVTAPDPTELYRFLAQSVAAKCQYIVIEMTSHGSYQYRNWGIRPYVAGLTNITHEHLDYHQNYAEYAKAKLQQFRGAQKFFFPEGDRSYPYTRSALRSVPIKFYSLETEVPKQIAKAIKRRFVERYNQKNAILATLIAQELSVPDVSIAKAITTFAGVPGRMEVIPSKKPFKIVVDFAHTPNAVTEVLTHLRKETKGKLYVILGCAGLRDHTKRPKMGLAAAKIADLACFTSEDPRIENSWTIIGQMKSQLGAYYGKVISMPDRGKAIQFVISTLAKKGDTVAILGKGHEQSFCIGTTEYAWNDRQAVETVLKTGEIPTLGKVLT
ncbi:hypothetical protein KC921_04580 [Candidatus Woesebacteria bacterium]|nr:hypothetical protein [Candidatus Woesebacteria bacterium]